MSALVAPCCATTRIRIREHSANADLAALQTQAAVPPDARLRDRDRGVGPGDFKVRRQYAQSLIELKEFDDADGVLTALIKETTAAQHAEQYEARGLMGRLLSSATSMRPAADAKRLVSAIETYWSAFRENNDNVWHGINAASCILRAHADGIAAPAAANARAIAKKILGVLARRQAKNGKKPLDVWDYATRVEALVDLREYREAAKVLDEYLVHPDMDAFEVSSTYRQFDEVLQLGTHKDKIAGAAHRRGWPRRPSACAAGGLVHVDSRGAKPMLVRGVAIRTGRRTCPDLEIHARLGTICSVTGSDRAVEALLRDPLVIAMRRAGPRALDECDRSLPFVKVADEYNGIAGTFAERGKRRARRHHRQRHRRAARGVSRRQGQVAHRRHLGPGRYRQGAAAGIRFRPLSQRQGHRRLRRETEGAVGAVARQRRPWHPRRQHRGRTPQQDLLPARRYSPEAWRRKQESWS